MVGQQGLVGIATILASAGWFTAGAISAKKETISNMTTGEWISIFGIGAGLLGTGVMIANSMRKPSPIKVIHVHHHHNR